MKTNLNQYEVWFVTGSQHLYGEETLKQVAVHSQEIAEAFDKSNLIPVQVKFKPVLTTPDSIYQLCLPSLLPRCGLGA
jgi:L-arabinose isomerase